MNPESLTRRLKLCAVIAILLLGLAMVPGYLLLCGHTSGSRLAEYRIYSESEGRAASSQSLKVALTRQMNPVGFNMVIATPFREHSQAEQARHRVELLLDGRQVWTADFRPVQGYKKEALAGTTFTVRAKTFNITEDGQYEFRWLPPQDMNNVRSVMLETRANTRIANPAVLGIGLALLAIVCVWAIIPVKGHDPASERIGTKWWED